MAAWKRAHRERLEGLGIFLWRDTNGMPAIIIRRGRRAAVYRFGEIR